MTAVGDDLYARLQVAPQASPDEVEAAYARLADLYSPERLQDAPPEFQELGVRRRADLAEAFAVLRDPLARAEYDRARSGPPVVETLDYRPLPPAGKHERLSPSVPLPAVAVRPERTAAGKRSPRSLLGPLAIGAVVLGILLVLVLNGVRIQSGPSALATPAIPNLTLPYTPAQVQEARQRAEASQKPEDWKMLGDILYDNVMIMRERAPLSPQYLGALPQWLQSTAAYSRALELGAGPVARADLAVAYLYYGLGANEQAAIDEATAQIEQARADGPDEPRVLLNYGLVMAGLNPPREAQAIEAWRRIIEVAPDSVEAQRAQDLIASYGSTS
jgi:tetratricopeptide (TPR) repeat protein